MKKFIKNAVTCHYFSQSVCNNKISKTVKKTFKASSTNLVVLRHIIYIFYVIRY